MDKMGNVRHSQRLAENTLVIFPSYLQSHVLNALKKAHPYEEVAYYLTRLENPNQEVGAGMIGDLETPLEPLKFLKRLKQRMEFRNGII